MKRKIIHVRGRKKKAIARAAICTGTGIIKLNGKPLKILKPTAVMEIISEPLVLAQRVLGDGFASGVNIQITAQGGGIIGQAYAARTAVGKALVDWAQNDELKKLFLAYDRSLIIDDIRKKEPKKYLRKGARAKPIKSYR